MSKGLSPGSRPWFLVQLSLLVLACREAGPPPADFIVEDSGGVEVVTNNFPLWTDSNRWVIDTLPTLVIGLGSSAPGVTLFSVGDLVELEGERVVLENRGLRELLELDLSEKTVELWGEVGDAVGGLKFSSGLFPCGNDRLLVREFLRFLVLDSRSGSALEMVELPEEALIPSYAVRIHGVTKDCRALLVSRELGDWRPWKSRTETILTLVYWTWMESERLDTIGVFPGNERIRLEVPGEHRAIFPFNLMPSWATDGELAYFGVGDQPEIQVFDPQGLLLRIVRWKAEPESIDESDWVAYEAERRAYLGLSDSDERFVVTKAQHPRPDWKPFFSGEEWASEYYPGLRLDSEGNLWVRRSTLQSLFRNQSRYRPIRSTERWWVFNPEGRWLGEVTTPENLLIKHIGDTLVFGVSRDPFDAEGISVFRLRKHGGAIPNQR